jgi:hypothetical protein
VIGSYSAYKTKLSDKVIAFRDDRELAFKQIANRLIAEGYRSTRGFALSPESLFSIYKKCKIQDPWWLCLLCSARRG